MDLQSSGELSLDKHGYTLFHDIKNLQNAKELLRGFGDFIPQANGRSAYQVQYRPGYESYLFTKSNNPIGCHTEQPFDELPPKYLALYCKEPANCGGGQTCLYDTVKSVDELDEHDLKCLSNEKISFKVNQSKQMQSKYAAASGSKPILHPLEDGKYIFRYSHNLFFYGDINANKNSQEGILSSMSSRLQNIVNRIQRHYDGGKELIGLSKGTLLIWDNHRMLHGREKYSDLRRHLVRFCLRA